MKSIMYKLAYFALFLILLLNSGCGSVAQQTGNRPPTAMPLPGQQQPLPNNQGPGIKWSGALEVTNQKIYKKLLKAYQVCDPWGAWFAIGSISCRQWDDNAAVHLDFNRKELPANVTLQIFPVHSQSWSDPNTYPSLTPLNMQGQAISILDGEGFHARFSGRVGRGGISPVIVRTASSSYSFNMDDPLLEIDLYYGGSAKEAFKFGFVELMNTTQGNNQNPQNRTR